MVAAFGEGDEPHVALEHDGLGGLRRADQPEARGELALVHHALAGEVRVLGVVHDQRVEIAGVGERTPHHLGVGDAARAVGEADRAGGLEQADLGHLLAHEALGEGRHHLHVDDAGVAGAAHDEVDDGRIVDRGLGVGLADDGGDAAGGRGLACGCDGLAAFRAGLADEGAHVDQAGGDDLAAAVDHLGAFGNAGRADAALGLAHHAVGEQEVTRQVEIARRVHDPRIGEQDRAAVAAVDQHQYCSVIPGRAGGANPESRQEFGMCIWIPGPALRAVPE